MTTEEKQRYSRQISVEEIGESGQTRLLCSKVIIVGCGALGSMVAMQLAAAGIGKILIADFDTVDISNLQRQFFFSTEDAGKMKADTLSKRMMGINPECKIEIIQKLVDRNLAKELFKDCDFIVDATDNPASKIMIEEVCRDISKACCIGGVSGFHGQVMTIKSAALTFKEIFDLNNDIDFMPCSAAGVIGPAAALCASIQASEVVKYLTGAGDTLENSMLTFDLLTNTFRKIEF
ncbi:MAG: HesA/MoeB/ThiF family protein [Bacteroides sp.]|nr:HesA/MoeB/ThiF family protein [Bacteroides sp.]